MALDPQVVGPHESRRHADQFGERHIESVDRQRVGDGRGLEVDVDAAIEVKLMDPVH